MAGVFVDEGLPDLAAMLVAELNNGFYALGLYQNNIPPDSDTVWADLTEADFTGYLAETISDAAVDSLAAHIESITVGPVTFTRTAGATSNTIYGCFIQNTNTGDLVYAELDATGPVSMSAAGTTLTVSLTIRLRDLVNA